MKKTIKTSNRILNSNKLQTSWLKTKVNRSIKITHQTHLKIQICKFKQGKMFNNSKIKAKT